MVFYKMRTQNNISINLDDIITRSLCYCLIQNGSSSESLIFLPNPNYRYWHFISITVYQFFSLFGRTIVSNNNFIRHNMLMQHAIQHEF